MKKISLLFSLTFLYFSVIAQSPETERRLNGIYIFKNNFCSASYLFKPNGEFFYEGGCEERSNISKGNYKIDGKKIHLITTAEPIKYSIYKENSNKKIEVQITLKDSEGKVLPYITVFTLSNEIQNNSIKSINYLETNSIGQLVINSSKISAISLNRYNPNNILNNKENDYHWEDISNLNSDKLTIQFNYDIFCLRYPEIVVTNSLLDLNMISNKTKLIDSENNTYTKTED